MTRPRRAKYAAEAVATFCLVFAGTGAVVVNRDVVTALREERARNRCHDLVLADPPYDEWARHEAYLAELLPEVLEEDGVAVIESSAKVEPALPLDLVTSRRYGSARITVFSR